MNEKQPLSRTAADRPAIWLGSVLLAAIALFFLWGEHRVHILGWLPWLLLLACLLIHRFMHRGHGHGGHGGGDDPGSHHHHDPTRGGQP